MSEESINKAYIEVVALIEQKRLREAFELIKAGLIESRCWDLQSSFDTICSSYDMMTQYMLQGVHDPKQQEMYDNIVVRLLEIADRVKILLLDGVSLSYYHTTRNRLKRMSEPSDTMRLIQNLQSAAMDISVCSLFPDKPKQTEAAERWYYQEKLLFDTIWTNIDWNSNEEAAADYILKSSPLTQTDLCLYIGAMTMSLLQCFDLGKLLWLFKVYGSVQLSAKVRQRAIVGIFFVLHVHAGRIKYYPQIKTRLSLLREQNAFARDMMQCYITFSQSIDTERITQIINNEIVPDLIKEMNKTQPSFDDKNEDEDRDVPKMIMPNIEDKDMQKKLERLSKMSMEGGDLYMNTFQNLKGFAFFHDLENWFKPFDVNQPCVNKLKEMGDKTSNTILSILKTTVYLCDNDKYSLVHLLPKMPPQQFEMMRAQLEQAEEMLNEKDIKDDLMEMDEADSKLQNVNYMHELYRFFKVSPRKKEFEDIFHLNIFEGPNNEINNIVLSSNQLLLLAEYLLKKKYWKLAGAVFELVATQTKGDDKSGTLFSHLGYAYQRQKKYSQALQAYLKAELFIPDNDWLKEQKAICYRISGQYADALSYYKELEAKNPENENILFNIGICLGETKEYDEALQYLFKLYYEAPENEKTWRAIGWYSFVCAKYSQAKTYYDKLLQSSSASALDFMNAGHVEWLLNNALAARNDYKQSFNHCSSKDEFIELFKKDIELLTNRGINRNNIPLMMDI